LIVDLGVFVRLLPFQNNENNLKDFVRDSHNGLLVPQSDYKASVEPFELALPFYRTVG
jgi:hypothetical protein